MIWLLVSSLRVRQKEINRVGLTESGEPLGKVRVLRESPVPRMGGIRLKGVARAACEDARHTWQGTQVALRGWSSPG